MLKAGTKLMCSGSGGNPDFRSGVVYTLEEVINNCSSMYLVTIKDSDDYLCHCIIDPVYPCPHAGKWEILD